MIVFLTIPAVPDEDHAVDHGGSEEGRTDDKGAGHADAADEVRAHLHARVNLEDDKLWIILEVHFGYISCNTDRHGVEGVDDGEAAGALRLRRDVADVAVDPQEEADLPARAVLQRLRRRNCCSRHG